ncbi:MAG: DUF2294 domain-containing protein [Jaaginema sp. PMC 1079.18]|nr:DUF2294 domain-containing protein [Jaaginema sp. PMC 1080.18]MEC4852534.1 DUF2294 domain-containing protein [Jaaginema sp. PMC 1079.18]MEC4865656.1 DUF2294 domain-containing protein [Jaaginema sp. PMC 1078.18]
MTRNNLISQQLKQDLFSELQQLYERELQHKLSHISCRVFDRTLVIFLEGTVTPPERILANNENQMLAREVRASLDRIIKPQIKSTIEKVLGMKIVDFLCDTTLDTDVTGAIVVFELESNKLESLESPELNSVPFTQG